MARIREVPSAPLVPSGPVMRLHFGPRDKIVIEGVAYRCSNSDDRGHVLSAEHDSQVTRAVTHEEMAEIRRLNTFGHDREWYAIGDAKARLHAGVPGLSHLPKKERERIGFKYDFVMAFLALEKSDPTLTRGDPSMKAAIERIAAALDDQARAATAAGRRRRAGRKSERSDAPGPKRLLQWTKMLIDGNYNPLSLRNDYRNCGRKPDNDTDKDDLLDEFTDRWLIPSQPSIASVHDDMETEIGTRNAQRAEKALPLLKLPSYDALCERIKEVPAYEKVASREGAEKAMKQFRPVGEGLQDVYRPMQHTEMDHWNIQLHVLCKKAGIWDGMTADEKKTVEKARYVLGAVVCRRTRCFAALRMTPTATAQSAIELLDMAVSEKHDYAMSASALTPWDIHGTMGWMITDGGFANYAFKQALLKLRIGFEIPPNGLAHLRGLIERSFRKLHQGVIDRFDGRTFQNIIRKGDYNSEARAGNCVDELAFALVRWAVDVHHNTPHPSLNYETPRECWLRLTKGFGVDPSPDWHKRRHVFGLEDIRTLGPAGIRVLNVQYRSEKLHDWFKQHGVVDVEIRVDERNLGAISVRTGEHWLTVMGPPDFEGVPAWLWIEAEADQRRRGRRTADVTAPVRLKAFGDIRDIAEVGRKRIGIDDARTTIAEIRAAERNMTIGADFPEQRDLRAGDMTGDLYDDALEVGASVPEPAPQASAPPPPAASPPVARPAKRKFSFKE